jgi:hypothetical protein
VDPLVLELRLFIDYWNFTARWRDVAGADQVCWPHLLETISVEAGRVLRLKQPGFQGISFRATARLYTSVFNPPEAAMRRTAEEAGIAVTRLEAMRANDERHRNWATGGLAALPGWLPSRLEPLRITDHPMTCLRCNRPLRDCPGCVADVAAAKTSMVVRREKGVDMRLGTELVEFAIDRSKAVVAPARGDWFPSVAVVLSNDGDYIPAVEMARAKGAIVVSAAWQSARGPLPEACTAVAWLDDIRTRLTMGAGCPQIG